MSSDLTSASKVEKDESNAVDDSKNALEEMSENAQETFPIAVERALAEVLPSEDSLDSVNFDPIEYINHHFPDESALGRLEEFSESLDKSIRDLDTEINDSVVAQALSSQQTMDNVKVAKESISKLYVKIKDIKSKAEQSEVMVEDICRDIKQLDNAKKHLTTTITTLHKLQTWVTGIDQLRIMVKTKNFDAAAHLLGAVTDLSAHFKSYMGIARIKRLHDAVVDIRLILKDEVEDRFREVGALKVARRGNGESMDGQEEAARRRKNIERLRPATRVVDIMGSQMRERVVKHFLSDQMREYADKYGPNHPGFSLALVEKRYMWYRLLDRRYDLECKECFPPSWHMSHRLAFTFCEETRDHVASLLDDESDTHEMISALKATLNFERMLVRRFEKKKSRRRNESDASDATTDYDDESDSSYGDDVEYDDEGRPLDPKSVEAIRRKWARQKSERAASKDAANVTKRSQEEVPPLDVRSMDGLISSVFAPYMSKYVSLERENLAKMMERLVKSGSSDVQKNIFMSALQMFNAMKQSMNRCKVVSKSQAFFSLQKEFKLCFEKYASHLKALMPKMQRSSSLGEHYVIKDDDERRRIAFVANTAAYCTDTIPQLEEIIQTDIDRAFSEHVDMNEESEIFYDVINTAITVLVSSVIADLDPAMQSMVKTQWESFDTVGDQSEYISKISTVLKRSIPTVRASLQHLYFSSFCDRFASAFLPRFMEHIYKCRNVGEMAAQQLLLDTCAVKDLVLALPVMVGPEEDRSASTASKEQQRGNSKRSEVSLKPTFVKIVNHCISKAEVFIKIVGTPHSSMVSSFKMLWPKGTAEDLQKIMAVKGMSAREQQDCLEKNGMKLSSSGGGDDSAKQSATTLSSVFASSAISTTALSSEKSRAGGFRGNVKSTAESLASMFNFRNS